MKRLALVAALALAPTALFPVAPLQARPSAGAVSAALQTVAAPAGGPDRALAARYFAEAHALAARDAGRLWGVSLDGPLIFVDAPSRLAVADRADAEGKLARDGAVFVGRIPDEVPVANTAVEWGGVRWTMVLWPLPEDADARARLLAHEIFHRVQEKIGLHASGPSNAHLDTPEGRRLLRLEWRALRGALTAKSARARHLAERDALAFRAARHAAFAGSAAEERALETHEGLAEYTGCAVAGRTERERVAGAVKDLDVAEAKASFTRSFAYATGPAYGLLLDAERAAGWRRAVRPDDDLALLLAKAARVPALASGARAAATRYGGDAVRDEEARRDVERRERLAAYRARFVDGPVLSMPLGTMQLSFDPNGLVPLEGRGTVYATLRISDAWGVLDAKSGALVSSDWKRVTVPADGAGWTLTLADGWRTVPDARSGDLTVAKAP